MARSPRGRYVCFFVEVLVELGLNGLGFGELFCRETASLQHIEKVCVTAGVELIRSIKTDTSVGEQPHQGAVDDSSAYLTLNVVTDDRNSCSTKFVRPALI